MQGRDSDLLTRAECNVLRGIAILGIFLHNYCHWLGPVVKENEYQYFQHNVDWLTRCIAHADALLPCHLISFFGHYGVPIFLFLSAYGLERKYGGRPGPRLVDNHVAPIPFIRYHFLKLFKMMIVGFICFTIIDAITLGSWKYNVEQIVGQLMMINNWFVHPDDNIWPGPFWFFGLMLQLYIIYRLFLYRRHWGWNVGLMVVCTGVQLLMDPEGETLNYWRYNFMGGMLPFGLGLLFARYGEKIMIVRLNFGGLLMSWWPAHSSSSQPPSLSTRGLSSQRLSATPRSILSRASTICRGHGCVARSGMSSAGWVISQLPCSSSILPCARSSSPSRAGVMSTRACCSMSSPPLALHGLS